MPAKTLTNAKNLALIKSKNEFGDSIYILYDPVILVDLFKFIYAKAKKENPKLGNAEVKYIAAKILENSDYLKEKNKDFILATLHARKDSEYPEFSIVERSAANKGYGPLIYDIAMSEEGGLISDRQSVSEEARHIWSYYLNYRDDVTKEPLYEDKDMDLENPLDYGYKLKKKINTRTLEENHKYLIKWVKNNMPDFDILNSSLYYFSRKYY